MQVQVINGGTLDFVGNSGRKALTLWESSTMLVDNGSVFAIVDYEKFSVTCDFIDHCYSAYSGAVYGESESLIKAVGLSGIEKAETDEFVQMLKTGKTHYDGSRLVAPVRFTEGIIKSYSTGKKIKL